MVRGGQTFSSSGGCPSEFDTTRYLCTCTFDTTPDDATAELLMVDSTGATVSEITIELSDWNKCGRDIAYTEYTPDDDAWSQTRYLNPCGSP